MQKKLITAAAIAAALMSGCAAQPTSTFEPPFQAQDLNPLLAAGYTQKVDNFFIINDSSSSMREDYLGLGYTAQPNPTKFSVEKEILSRINQTIPNLPNPLTESIRSFGFGPCIDNGFTKLNQEPTSYSKETFSNGISSLECASGGSPLDDGIVGSTQDLSASAGKIAVLVMSDGYDLDSYGTKEMQAMKAQYGDRLCVYGVWTGNPEERSGLAVLNQLSSIAGCGFAVSAEQVSTSEGMGKFVKSIFLQAGAPAVDPCSLDDDHDGVGNCQDKCPNTLSGVHVNQYGCWVVDIKFDNNKSDLRHSDVRNPKVAHELDEVANAIINHPEVRIEVQGHTSHTGPQARNIVLGKERALTIRKYLSDRHPEIANRLSSQGYSWDRPIEGTNPADAVNRRVQFEVMQ